MCQSLNKNTGLNCFGYVEVHPSGSQWQILWFECSVCDTFETLKLYTACMDYAQGGGKETSYYKLNPHYTSNYKSHTVLWPHIPILTKNRRPIYTYQWIQCKKGVCLIAEARFTKETLAFYFFLDSRSRPYFAFVCHKLYNTEYNNFSNLGYIITHNQLLDINQVVFQYKTLGDFCTVITCNTTR